jgi:hypothetical protein
MQIHSVFLESFDANRGCFEFRSSRLRVDGVDGQLIRGYLIVRMHCEESQAASETGIEANRRDHGSPPRKHAHFLAFV